jgi:hypothetical protein
MEEFRGRSGSRHTWEPSNFYRHFPIIYDMIKKNALSVGGILSFFFCFEVRVLLPVKAGK